MTKTTREIGDIGESIAFDFLEKTGGIILERNYRFRRGEVDIIVDLFGVMVFIEVKYRKNNKFGFPEEFLSDSQIERIHSTAEEYCERFEWRGPIRFDILAVEGSDQKITHFKDAF